MTDLAERIVEAAGAVVFDHDGIIPADQDASRRCARAAIAAAVREAGLTVTDLGYVAMILRRNADDFDPKGSPHSVRSLNAGDALLRALAGIADAR